MSSRPWHNLKRITKVEILPGEGSNSVNISLQEDVEYEDWHDGSLRSRIIASDRKIVLTNENLKFHSDYPDDFKKLVAFYRGNFSNAYDVYTALQKPVPDNWDKLQDDKVRIDDCDC